MASKETALELFDQWAQQEAHETQDKDIGHNTLVGSKELDSLQGDSMCLIAREHRPQGRVLAALTAKFVQARKPEIRLIQVYVTRAERRGARGPYLARALIELAIQVAMTTRKVKHISVGAGLAGQRETSSFLCKRAGFCRPHGFVKGRLSQVSDTPLKIESMICRRRELELHVRETELTAIGVEATRLVRAMRDVVLIPASDAVPDGRHRL